MTERMLTVINSFGAKFQMAFIVCFFILTNYRLERRLYVKLIDWMSNSVDPDEMAQLAISSGTMLFAKAYYYRLWQWELNLNSNKQNDCRSYLIQI